MKTPQHLAQENARQWGSDIARDRMREQLTVDEAAESAGLTPQTIRQMEQGRWQDVDPDAVPDLSDAATVGAVLTLVWDALPYGSTFSLDRTPRALPLWRAASWMLEKVGR